MASELLSTAEAASLIGISLRGVQKLIERGTLPAQKLGRDWFVKRRDAERAKENRPKQGWQAGRPRKPQTPPPAGR